MAVERLQPGERVLATPDYGVLRRKVPSSEYGHIGVHERQEEVLQDPQLVHHRAERGDVVALARDSAERGVVGDLAAEKQRVTEGLPNILHHLGIVGRVVEHLLGEFVVGVEADLVTDHKDDVR